MTENAAEKIRLVPLAALVTTDWNVRTTQADRTAMAELKASILAHQLISPLAVRIGDRTDGTLEVIAGRRRHQALRELCDEKQIPADYEVPCRVLDEKADETEVALAENVCRVAMDPLDQSATFTALVAAGASIEGISTRFGISTRTVEQRLRLTTIAPEIIAAYKDGGLKLKALNAFGNTTDHERQLQVWKRLREGYQVTPDAIDRYLRDEQVAATSSRAKHLGLDAFTAAGGHIETNLFGDDEATYLIEVQLPESLGEGQAPGQGQQPRQAVEVGRGAGRVRVARRAVDGTHRTDRRRAHRRAPRWRSPRRASARSWPHSPLPAASGRARVLAGYRRTASDRGRGQARPFGVSDLV